MRQSQATGGNTGNHFTPVSSGDVDLVLKAVPNINVFSDEIDLDIDIEISCVANSAQTSGAAHLIQIQRFLQSFYQN